MQGDVGPSELLLLLLLAVVLFGAQRLPQIGRSLGKAIREFKEALANEHDSIDTREASRVD
jgi:sec-independent protein translocase protein TatA